MHIAPRHRHLLVAPLFALALAASLLPRSSVVRGAEGERALPPGEVHAAEDRPFVLADGTQGVLRAGSRMTVSRSAPILEEGTLLLASARPFELRSGERDVRGVGGTITVIARGGKLTVAALTAPALVRWRDQRILVPIGMQWRSGDADPEPLRGDEWSRWAAGRAVSLVPAEYLEGHASGWDLEPDRALAASVLTDGDPDAWLLASLHPELWAAAWTSPEPAGAPRASRALRLLLLPAAGIAAPSLPPLIVKRWAEAVSSFLSFEHRPAEFLEHLLRQSLSPVGALARRGHPARAHELASALSLLAQPYARQLSEEGKALLLDLQRLDAQVLQGSLEASGGLPATSPPPHPAPVNDTPPASASEDEAAARRMLGDAGAVFTVRTHVQTIGPRVVAIRGVVFAGARGDRTLDFSLDLARGEVRDLVVGGKTVPYPVSWQTFLRHAGD